MQAFAASKFETTTLEEPADVVVTLITATAPAVHPASTETNTTLAVVMRSFDKVSVSRAPAARVAVADSKVPTWALIVTAPPETVPGVPTS